MIIKCVQFAVKRSKDRDISRVSIIFATSVYLLISSVRLKNAKHVANMFQKNSRNLNIKATMLQYMYANSVENVDCLCLAIILCAPNVCLCFVVLDLSVQHAIKIHSSQEILKIPRSGPVFFPLTFPPKIADVTDKFDESTK